MQMRPSLIIKTLEALYDNHLMNDARHLNLLIEGEPGCGKTSVVKSFAKLMTKKTGQKFGYCHVHVPTYQPEDLSLPFINDNRTSYDFLVPEGALPFEWSGRPEDDPWPDMGVVCLDEMPAGSEAVQKSLANLTLERSLHRRNLKAGWMVVATGNRQQDRAGNNRILSHLRDRFTTVEFIVSYQDWIEWYKTTPNPKEEAIAFVRAQPDMLQKFDPKVDISPTARSWTDGVFALLGVLPKECEAPMFMGAVGSAAQLFRNFLTMWRDWPNPEQILANPKNYPVPDGDEKKQGKQAGAICYGISGVLATLANKDNIENVMIYLKRMPPEYMVLSVKTMLQRDNSLTKTATIKEWIKTHGNELVSG